MPQYLWELLHDLVEAVVAAVSDMIADLACLTLSADSESTKDTGTAAKEAST